MAQGAHNIHIHADGLTVDEDVGTDGGEEDWRKQQQQGEEEEEVEQEDELHLGYEEPFQETPSPGQACELIEQPGVNPSVP